VTLAELRQALELLPNGALLTLPRDALLEALAVDRPEISPAREALPEPAEEWLTAEQCAELLNVSPRWCYDHAKELGARKLSRRCVRFSSRAVSRRLARRG
jgi:hypothetical protein